MRPGRLVKLNVSEFTAKKFKTVHTSGDQRIKPVGLLEHMMDNWKWCIG